MAKLSSLSPSNNASITTTSTTISALVGSVKNSFCTVFLEVSKFEDFSSLFYSSSKTANSGNTVSFAISGLFQGNYYWRMRVEDGDIISNYTAYRGLYVNISVQTTGRLSPDANQGSVNLTGSVTAIDDDPDAPDASWITASSLADTKIRVSFPTPSGPLASGAGLQNFRARVRSNNTKSTVAGTILMQLYENGTKIVEQSFSMPGNSTGTVIQYNWDAALISDPANVECRIEGWGNYSGNANSQYAVDFGAIEWNYQLVGGETQSNAPVDVAPASATDLVATATATATENFVRLFWTEPSDNDLSHVEVYKDSVLINDYHPENQFGDSDVVPGQTYHFEIIAVDMAGNKSNAIGVDIIAAAKSSKTPVVSVTNISRTKISDEAGVNQSLITLKFDKNVIAWKLKSLGVSHDTGVLVESGDILIAGTETTATIDWNELNTEGLNRINIYGFDGAFWTPYNDDSEPEISSHNFTTFKYGTSKYGKN